MNEELKERFDEWVKTQPPVQPPTVVEKFTINGDVNQKTYTLMQVMAYSMNTTVAELLDKAIAIFAVLSDAELAEFSKRQLFVGVGQPADVLQNLQNIVGAAQEKPADQANVT